MLGWWIIVTAQAPGHPAPGKETVLATWETSPNGIDWLDRLVEQGKALQGSTNGYPCSYTAKARDVLPLIAKGPPSHSGPDIIGDDYVMPGHWSGNITLQHEAIAACPPDLELCIEAWDQS